MNLNYIIGVVGALAVCLFGMITTINLGGSPPVSVTPQNLLNFVDPASILITIGCTIFVVVASFPGKMLREIPKHIKIILGTKRFDPITYIDQLVELAQIARKNGLLSLEEKANEQPDPFFKQAIMMIVDAYDPDKVRSILENDIECMSARHDDAAAMYDKAFADCPKVAAPYVAPYSHHVFHQYTLQLAEEVDRDALIAHLNGKGIPAMIYYPVALRKQKAYDTHDYDDAQYPNTDLLVQRVMSLPMHTELDQEQVDYIAGAVKEFLK